MQPIVHLFLDFPLLQVHHRINHLEHLVVLLHDHKGTHSFYAEVKVLNNVLFLIEESGLKDQLLLEPGTDPGQEVLVAQGFEKVEFFEVFLMDLL